MEKNVRSKPRIKGSSPGVTIKSVIRNGGWLAKRIIRRLSPITKTPIPNKTTPKAESRLLLPTVTSD
jgi:hypothetical protein